MLTMMKCPPCKPHLYPPPTDLMVGFFMPTEE
nr:MAG TPA: DNA-directed RNA polymerase II subunit [Caudoviricetes sp.]